MTPYSRGYAAGQEEMRRRAAETCKTFAKTGRDIAADPVERSQLRNSAALQALAADTCADYILSLPIEGEATNPGEQVPDSARIGSVHNHAPTTPDSSGPCVVVPVERESAAKEHPSCKPFNCPHCGSHYFGPTFRGREIAGRYCKGWPSGDDRSYKPCPAQHVEWYEQEAAMLAAAREEHDAHR